MVHPYLRRRQGLEKPDYPREDLKPALERTLGVPIFQEQVMQVAIIAAGFTPGEADQLRRAMAAWKRKGGLEHYYKRIVEGMMAKGYPLEFAERIFSQIQGFGEYGFPESHAASFALLAYASSWAKCHEPAAFTCALLNSQPMGFYSPSQLVQDARRHGIEVRPCDIAISGWDSTLEEIGPGLQPAIRLGFSLQRGMRQETALRIEATRAIRPFADVADLSRRAQLDRHDLQVLAASNALRSLAGHRRQALWEAVGAVADKDLLRPAPVEEALPQLRAPGEADEIVSDYQAQGLTLGRHPLALLRERLYRQRFIPAEVLEKSFEDGQLARACGIVTVRQRPGTAKGVMFVTIEDETGNVNVIVWSKLLEQQRKELLGSALLGVYGIWQKHGEVKHLLAKRVVDLSHLLGELDTRSRNFC
jgi:error-prone DNA polymerase